MPTTITSAGRKVRAGAVPSSGRPKSARMVLQGRSGAIIQRHLLRSFVRVTVLFSADLLALVFLRAIIGMVRAGGLHVHAITNFVSAHFPLGYLGGWQFAVALPAGLLIAGTYGRGDSRKDPARVLKGVLLATSLALWQSAWNLEIGTVALQFAATVAAIWSILLVGRLILDYGASKFFPRTVRAGRAVFVGDPSDGAVARLADKILDGERTRCCGWVSSDPDKVAADYLGAPSEIWRILRDTRADIVVLCSNLTAEEFSSVVEAARVAGCRILSLPRYEGVPRVNPKLLWHRGLPLIELTVPSTKGHQLIVKRGIDIVGALSGLVLLAPLFVLTGLAVQLSSQGPIFYKQWRIGKAGKRFQIIKFRTMVVGAETQLEDLKSSSLYSDDRLFKVIEDPRVTRVGQWLRRWSIDELPQLLNVLLGDMSLVGTRPPLPSEVECYDDDHFCRFDMKPGMTGPWQVSGRNTITNFEDVVRLESEYVRNWSILEDFKILGKTVPVVLRKDGAH